MGNEKHTHFGKEKLHWPTISSDLLAEFKAIFSADDWETRDDAHSLYLRLLSIPDEVRHPEIQAIIENYPSQQTNDFVQWAFNLLPKQGALLALPCEGFFRRHPKEIQKYAILLHAPINDINQIVAAEKSWLVAYVNHFSDLVALFNIIVSPVNKKIVLDILGPEWLKAHIKTHQEMDVILRALATDADKEDFLEALGIAQVQELYKNPLYTEQLLSVFSEDYRKKTHSLPTTQWQKWLNQEHLAYIKITTLLASDNLDEDETVDTIKKLLQSIQHADDWVVTFLLLDHRCQENLLRFLPEKNPATDIISKISPQKNLGEDQFLKVFSAVSGDNQLKILENSDIDYLATFLSSFEKLVSFLTICQNQLVRIQLLTKIDIKAYETMFVSNEYLEQVFAFIEPRVNVPNEEASALSFLSTLDPQWLRSRTPSTTLICKLLKIIKNPQLQKTLLDKLDKPHIEH